MPSIIAKYLEELSEHTASGGTYAYRGQENADWPVESAAYRRLKRIGESFAGEHFINYHEKAILEPARMNGYGVKDGYNLSDLELLAELQHFGAATCLIDFTRDFLIALWFACKTFKDENNQEKDGKIFILNINQTIFLSLEQKDLKHNEIEAILNFQARPSKKEPKEITFREQSPFYWHWSPHDINQRILRQQSLFVFGKPNVDNDHLIEIQVLQKDKEEILKELERLGITRESLFKDMPGFAASHSHNEPISIKHRSAEFYYEAGNEALQKDNPEKAKYLYTEAIEHKHDFVDAYYNRGLVKSSLGDYEGAIEDYTKAIENKPDSSAYYNRGCVKSSLGDYEGAIEDYTKAIENKPHFISAYFNRGLAKVSLGDYDGAKMDFTAIIDIMPDYVHAHYALGDVYIKLSDNKEARNSFQLAKELAEQNNDNQLVQKIEQRLSKLGAFDEE